MIITEKKLVSICKNMIKYKYTLRQCEEKYGICKSTLHSYIHKNLKDLNKLVYVEVIALLEMNKKVAHIRGGFATQEKYNRNK